MRPEQTAAIRDDIERTRDRMGDTIEALGERLNPARIRQQVKENIREATIGRVQNMANNAKHRVEEGGRGLVATIRENPIPAAMIVGGLGWLLFARRSGDAEVPVVRQPVVSELEPVWTENAHGSLEAGNGDSSAVSGAAHKVADSASTAAHKVADTASTAASKVAGAASTVGSKVSHGVSSAAHGVASQARAQSQRVASSFESNPLAIGAIAAGVGLAIGMSIPSTEREGRLMGEKRDELMDKAKARVSETKDKVVSAAERIVPEVRGVVTESVKEMKATVTETVKDVAREEGLAG